MSVDEAKAYQDAAPALTVMIGNGNANLPALRAGLHIVSGDCCGVAWALTKLVRLHAAGDAAGADAVQQALLSIWRATVMDGFDEVPAVKAAFGMLTGSSAACRPPLLALKSDEARVVIEGIARLRAAVDAVDEDEPAAASSALPAKRQRRANC